MKIKTTAALLPFLFLFAIGCMKTPELNKNFGTENTAAEWSKALKQAQSEATSASMMNIQKSQFAYYEHSTQIENLNPVIFKQRAETVTERVEDGQKIVFTITHEQRELDHGGSMKPSKSQSSACLEKVHGSNACASGASILSLAVESIVSAAKDVADGNIDLYSAPLGDISVAQFLKRAQSDTPSDNRYTYYNLKKSSITTDVPWLVSKRKKCGGSVAQPCKPLRIIRVAFDEVDWEIEKYPVKSSYVLDFSADSPFFASQISSCGSTTMPYQNQRIALMQCEIVKDYTAGDPDDI